MSLKQEQDDQNKKEDSSSGEDDDLNEIKHTGSTAQGMAGSANGKSSAMPGNGAILNQSAITKEYLKKDLK